jgi:hypothetical protein
VLAGCAELEKIDWVSVAVNAARNGAQIGTIYALKEKPDTKDIFEAVVTALDKLLKDGDLDNSKIVAVLQRLPLGQGNVFGGLIISNIVTIYDIATSTYIDLQSSPVAEKIVTAIRDGIQAGIEAPKALEISTVVVLKPGKRVTL